MMSSSWLRDIGSHEVPVMSGEEIQASYEELETTRHTASPIDYFEQTMSTAAAEVDRSIGEEKFAVGLTDARNNPELRNVYFYGAQAGKSERDRKYISANADTFGRRQIVRAEVGKLLLPRTGRVRLDKYDDFKDLPEGSKRYRLNELENIDQSGLGDDFKAIVFSMLYTVHTSEAIKTRADKQRLVIPDFVTPDISFKSLYAGRRGTQNSKGFASYVGAYESLNKDTQELLINRYEDESEEAAALIGCVLFLKTSQRQSSTRMEDLRDIRLDILKHVENGEFELAREYLAELYAEEPGMFTEVSVSSVFGEDIPEVNERASDKAPENLTKESMQGKPVDAKTAKAYCGEVLGLDEKEIISRGEAMVGKLFGVTAPEDDTKEKRVYDFIHFERLSKMNTQTKRDILLASILDLDAEDKTNMVRREPWRRMSFETAITMQDLGRFVELGDSLTLDDITSNQAEYISRLSAIISDKR